MKRIVILFLAILLVRTICFSSTISETIAQDSIVSITSEQLKYANLIFIEHKQLLKENKLLHNQVKNYQLKTDYLLQTDSLRVSQLKNYLSINDMYVQQIYDLNKAIKKENYTVTCWKIGSITVTVGLVLFLLLK